jgi:hypothetical protein
MRSKGMRGLLTAVLMVGMLSAFGAAPASATGRPTYWYGSQHTPAHGYIVKAGNDSYTHTIRTRCHWNADGQGWTTNWVIHPRHLAWTTSDAGAYGDHAPTGLRCTYSLLS